MATDARARELGFSTPSSTDLIREGDNAISQNARAAVDLHDRSVAIANAARAMAASAVTAAADGTGITQDVATGRLYYAPAPVIADDFNRPDESPVGPTPIGYAPLVPASGQATLAVDANQLAFTNTVNTTGYATWDTRHTDGVFSITILEHAITTDRSGIAVVVRATPDAADAIVLDASLTDAPNPPQYRVRRRTAGAWESGQSTLGTAAAAGDRIDITLNGPEVTFTINGTPRLTATFPDHTTGTGVGVGCFFRQYGVRYDDMSFVKGA